MLKMFRWQGLLGFVAFVGLLVLFWMFYASTLIKNTIESYGSDIVGAKVEVAQVNLSFDPLGLELRDLAIADADHPMKNLVQFNKINARMALTPLLLGKVIIHDMSMDDVSFDTPRKTSGALKKVEAPKPATSKTTAAKTDGGGGLLPDMGDVMPDIDIKSKIPTASEILSRETLVTEERGKAFKNSLVSSETELKDTLKALPNKQSVNQYKDEMNAIIKGKITSLADFEARKKKLADLKQRLKDDKQALKNAKELVNSTKADLQAQLKALKSAPSEDLKRLKEKYQMNFAGAGNISQLLFGDQVAAWLPRIQNYYKKAKPIIEKIKSAQEEEKERERLEGRFVPFPLSKPQPDFLIESMGFSVHLTNGDLVTEWSDITHQQEVMNRPTTLSITGKGFSDTASLDIKGLFDHRGDTSLNQLTMDMSGIKVKNLKLAGKKMLLNKANTHITGRVVFGLEAIDLVGQAKFLNTNFQNLGTSNVDKELGLILAKVDAFKVDASATGKPLRPNINMTSNLDKMIGDAMKERFHEKKAELEQKLKEKLTEKMLSYTGKYKEQFEQLDLANGTMEENRDKIEGLLKSELNDYIAEQKKLAQEKLEAAKQKAIADAKAKADAEKKKAQEKLDAAKAKAKAEADAAKKKEADKLKEKLLKGFGL